MQARCRLASGDGTYRLLLFTPVLIASGTASCSSSLGYTPHAMHSPSVDVRRTQGCVELGFFSARDPELPVTSLYLEIHVENRCNEPALVDIAALRMFAYGHDGSRRTLSLYDPRHQVIPLHVQARRAGVERFRVDGTQGVGKVDSVCIDATDVVPDARPTHGQSVCFDFSTTVSR